MQRPAAVHVVLDRLFGAAGVAALTAWLMSAQALRTPVPVQVSPVTIPAAPARPVRAPSPVVSARCVEQSPARRAPPRDPFAPRSLPTQPTSPPAPAPAPVAVVPSAVQPAVAALEPSIDETPAQPLPEHTVTVLGEALSTAGLSRAQVRLLETIAKLPTMRTQTVRGARFVRFEQGLYRDDCSNVLRIPYAAQGIDLFSEHPLHPDANGVSLIEHKGAPVTSPEVGDLVLFDDTWDRNRNGEHDDENTHAAIVVGFEPGGTVVLYNRVRSGHRLYRMNLRQPSRYRDPETKARLNDYLRRKRGADPEDLPRLTGELFAGYVRVL